jgi:hypothetical protein
VTYRVLCLAHRLVLALPPKVTDAPRTESGDAVGRAAPVSR